MFAPNSKVRALVTPAKRGKGKQLKTAQETQQQTAAEQRASMTWAQRLKRVFNIDIASCSACGGDVRIIACIEDPVVINKILAHLDKNVLAQQAARWPQSRAPQQACLFEQTLYSNARLL